MGKREQQRKSARTRNINDITCKNDKKKWRRNKFKDAVSFAMLDVESMGAFEVDDLSLVMHTKNYLKLKLGLELTKSNTPSRWEVTGSKSKLLYTQSILEQEGDAFCFTLHFSAKLRDSLAARKGKNFNSAVKQEIMRVFKSAGWPDPLMWFTTEQGVIKTTGELVPHLHGVISITGNHTINEARALLKRVGGKFIADNIKKRQLVMKKPTNGKGWVNYSMKNLKLTQEQISGKLLTISQSAKLLAKERYKANTEQYRRVLNSVVK